jgi:putative superfamily III holin-X
MADETAMNERGSTTGNGYGAPEHGMRGLVHDIAVLSELQVQLLAIDARAALRELLLPVAVIAVVVGLVLGSVIVGLMSVAYLLVDLAGWPHYAGFLTATVLGMAMAGGMLWGLRWRWQNRPAIFARSKEEFRENFDRVKGLLVRSPGGRRSDQTS